MIIIIIYKQSNAVNKRTSPLLDESIPFSTAKKTHSLNKFDTLKTILNGLFKVNVVKKQNKLFLSI